MEKVTFWYGCNVLRHGDIIHNCIDILQRVGIEAVPVGGPNYCCGSIKDTNPRAADGMARRSIEGMNAKGNARLIAWCPSCHLQMEDFMSKGYQTAFDMTYLVEVLHARRHMLQPHMAPVPLKIYLHRHSGFQQKVAVNTMVHELLSLIPQLEIVEDDYLAPGYMCHALAAVPQAMQSMLGQLRHTVAASRADAIVTIFHQCYRDLCGLETQGLAKVHNYIQLIARSLGMERPDEYKTWKNAGSDAARIVGEHRIQLMGGKDQFDRLVLPELLKLPPEDKQP